MSPGGGSGVNNTIFFGPASLLMKWLLPHGRALHNSDHPKFINIDTAIKNLSVGSK